MVDMVYSKYAILIDDLLECIWQVILWINWRFMISLEQCLLMPWCWCDVRKRLCSPDIVLHGLSGAWTSYPKLRVEPQFGCSKSSEVITPSLFGLCKWENWLGQILWYYELYVNWRRDCPNMCYVDNNWRRASADYKWAFQIASSLHVSSVHAFFQGTVCGFIWSLAGPCWRRNLGISASNESQVQSEASGHAVAGIYIRGVNLKRVCGVPGSIWSIPKLNDSDVCCDGHFCMEVFGLWTLNHEFIYSPWGHTSFWEDETIPYY